MCVENCNTVVTSHATVTQVDRKPHPLPEARVLSHQERWNCDKELHEYYAEQEKKM
jgi:hypothetical protein